MVAGPTPAELAVQMLEAQDVPTAVEVMGTWLAQVGGAAMAVRLSFRAGVTDWQIAAPASTPLPPAEEWPGPERFLQHPFTRFHRDTGSLRPTLLQDAVAAGWTPDAQTQEEYERLRLSPHQLTIPTARDPGELRRGDWRGWVLVAEEPLPPSAVGRLEEGLSTIVGADSHLGLLDRLAPAPPEAPPLTTRERMILTLLAQGRTAAGIASRLAISPRTVHKHQEHLYRKLGAVDRLSAVLAGQRLGLLPAPPLLDPVPGAGTSCDLVTPPSVPGIRARPAVAPGSPRAP